MVRPGMINIIDSKHVNWHTDTLQDAAALLLVKYVLGICKRKQETEFLKQELELFGPSSEVATE